MLNGLVTIIIVLLNFAVSDALHCLEGSDCVSDASCGECAGVACTRIVSHNLDDNKEIALTCLPFDTRSYSRPQLEEHGCRTQGDREICICYTDYCNSSRDHRQVFLLIIALSLLCNNIFL